MGEREPKRRGGKEKWRSRVWVGVLRDWKGGNAIIQRGIGCGVSERYIRGGSIGKAKKAEREGEMG